MDISEKNSINKEGYNKDKKLNTRFKLIIFLWAFLPFILFFTSVLIAIPNPSKLEANEFINYMKKNCEVIDALDTNTNEYINSHYITDSTSCPYNISYIVIENESIRDQLYSNLVNSVHDNNKNIIQIVEINSPNYFEFSTSGSHYIAAVMYEDSILYLDVTREYEIDAINIMKDFGYYYELTPITLLLMICTVISIVSLVMISLWKLNIKFGRKGWVSLIPVYNLLCLSEDVLGKKIYILFLLIPIINIIFLMILFYNLAKVFGKTQAYRIFTIFFFIIIVPFIAFDDSKYLGVEKK